MKPFLFSSRNLLFQKKRPSAWASQMDVRAKRAARLDLSLGMPGTGPPEESPVGFLMVLTRFNLFFLVLLFWLFFFTKTTSLRLCFMFFWGFLRKSKFCLTVFWCGKPAVLPRLR